jgi:hypothetical protein
MSQMFKQLLSIIESDEFRVQLSELNDNFFNLKQEIHIRNLLVELFNQKHKEQGERAIAEYRVNPNKNIRIDLALINKPLKERILIEFKYHFPEDRQIKKTKSLSRYFKERTECDYLISIICNDNEETRKDFENEWLIKNTFFANSYSKNPKWRKKIEEEFESLKSESKCLKPIEITVEKPFESTYHFFILERKK